MQRFCFVLKSQVPSHTKTMKIGINKMVIGFDIIKLSRTPCILFIPSCFFAPFVLVRFFSLSAPLPLDIFHLLEVHVLLEVLELTKMPVVQSKGEERIYHPPPSNVRS